MNEHDEPRAGLANLPAIDLPRTGTSRSRLWLLMKNGLFGLLNRRDKRALREVCKEVKEAVDALVIKLVLDGNPAQWYHCNPVWKVRELRIKESEQREDSEDSEDGKAGGAVMLSALQRLPFSFFSEIKKLTIVSGLLLESPEACEALAYKAVMVEDLHVPSRFSGDGIWRSLPLFPCLSSLRIWISSETSAVDGHIALRDCQKLRRLEFQGYGSDQLISTLTQLSQLHELGLSCQTFSAPALQRLSSLTQLTVFSSDGSYTAPAYQQPLQQCLRSWSQLTVLYLPTTRLGTDTALCLAQMPHLARLRVRRLDLGGQSLNLQAVTDLTVDGRISVQSLVALHLPSLQSCTLKKLAATPADSVYTHQLGALACCKSLDLSSAEGRKQHLPAEVAACILGAFGSARSPHSSPQFKSLTLNDVEYSAAVFDALPSTLKRLDLRKCKARDDSGAGSTQAARKALLADVLAR